MSSLQRIINVKYHIFIVSLILSSLLWISLNLDQTYEIQRYIPIKINVEKPYAIANVLPLNLDVKIKGKGWSLVRLFTSFKPEFDYDLNFNGNEKYPILVKQFLNESAGFNQGFSITYIKPETLMVQLSKYEEKYVKIVPFVSVVCRKEYQVVGAPVLDPDSIKIGGSSSLLSRLNSLYTQYNYYEGVNASINDVIKLSDSLSNVLWFSRNEVSLHISIELTAEKYFQNVELKVPDLPPDREVLLIPQNITVQLKGGVKQLSETDNTKIMALIDFNTILNDSTGAVAPRFLLPKGMDVISFKPDKIQYVIKKKI
jgi:YbbR domain-containing protein